jgi:hypothetical protein
MTLMKGFRSYRNQLSILLESFLLPNTSDGQRLAPHQQRAATETHIPGPSYLTISTLRRVSSKQQAGHPYLEALVDDAAVRLFRTPQVHVQRVQQPREELHWVALSSDAEALFAGDHHGLQELVGGDLKRRFR